jgi:hypothetical protein
MKEGESEDAGAGSHLNHPTMLLLLLRMLDVSGVSQ